MRLFWAEGVLCNTGVHNIHVNLLDAHIHHTCVNKTHMHMSSIEFRNTTIIGILQQ